MKNYKKLLSILFLFAFSLISVNAAYADKISEFPDAVVANPDDIFIFNDDGTTTKKGKISDQVWVDVLSQGAVCDGTGNTLADSSKDDASTGYASVAAAQTDFPNADIFSLEQTIDGVVIDELLNQGKRVYLPSKTCELNHNVSLPSGTYYLKQGSEGVLKILPVHTGTAQSATSTTIVLASDAPAIDDALNNSYFVEIVSGTGAGASREITDYVGSTKTATVAAWEVTPDNTSVYRVLIEQTIDCTDCEFHGENLSVDHNQAAQNFLYMLSSSGRSKIYLKDFYGYNAGSENAVNSNFVSPVWINGNVEDVNIKGLKCYNLHALPNGDLGDAEGSARCLLITPTGTDEFAGVVDNLYFDTEGSEAEELDIVNVNVGGDKNSVVTFNNAIVKLNGQVRRFGKTHSTCNIWNNATVTLADDFVTAPSAAGNTSVGEKNTRLFDFASSGDGCIVVNGGNIDWSAFQNGLISSAGSSSSFIKLQDGYWKGGIYQLDRYDPEKYTTGTALGGTSNTIQLNPISASDSNSTYGTNHFVKITSGTGSGQTEAVSSYNASTSTITISGTWTTTPDNTSVYEVYDPVTGTPIAFRPSGNDDGSGVDGTTFEDGYIPWQLNSNNSYATNTVAIDPVYHCGYINSTNKFGIKANYNMCITQTTGRLYDGFRIFPVQATNTDVQIVGNSLIQDGNTDHRCQYIDVYYSTTTGILSGNYSNGTTCAAAAGGTLEVVEDDNNSQLRYFDNYDILFLVSEQNSSFTAVLGKEYPVDTSSGAVTVTAPSSPSIGSRFGVFDSRNNAGTNNITIDFGSEDYLAQAATDYILSTNGESAFFKYINSTIGWRKEN